MSELDQDFQKTIDQINAKLKESAKALDEANELAISIGYKHGLIASNWARESEGGRPKDEDFDNEEDYFEAADDFSDKIDEKYNLIDVSDLEGAMMDAGWSTSSSYC